MAIESHNFLITGRAGTPGHFVATRALPLGNLRTMIQRCILFWCELRKKQTPGGNRFAWRFSKQPAMVARSPPGKQRTQQQYGTQQAYWRPRLVLASIVIRHMCLSDLAQCWPFH